MDDVDLFRFRLAVAEIADGVTNQDIAAALNRVFEETMRPADIADAFVQLEAFGVTLDELRHTGVLGIGCTLDKLKRAACASVA